ncbi:helix-turn-helix domain-containing protein [Streptomyces sp. TRM 70351]|nr:helix-turn-helix domain-containing protein [Streptomyces sp. TRM 70351]MEE1929799.1 helix-turn-helix domain-containing protein [Streptomyces sp. TRM 70351]
MGEPRETAAFAAYLRELKERSGRSYGYLAQRLHMSTSTLHRYCHGAAVPVAYAPVERIARLCGAGPEELVELHRRWLLADARRADRADRAERPPAAAPPAGAGPTAGAGTAAGPGEAAGAEAAGAEAVAPEAAAGPEPAIGADPDPEPVPDLAPAPDPDPEPAPGPAPAPAGSRAPAHVRFRRPAVVAVVVALALFLAPVMLALVRGGGTAPPSAEPPGPAARPQVPQDPGSPSADGSGSPSASGSAPASRSPQPAVPQAPRPVPAPPEGTARASGSAEPPRPGSAPLTVTARSHVWQAECGHRYLVDPGVAGPADVPPPPAGQDARAWAAELGAVHGGRTNLEVTVQGTGATPVVLLDLHVRVAERRTPLPWPSYAMDHGCGGALTPAHFAVDLDAGRPLTRPVDGYDAGGETGRVLPAERFPFRVSRAEPQVLRVNATTAGCDCAWYLELEWSAGGRTGTLRIDDAGRPFRTSGAGGHPQYGYWPDRGGWVREDL